MLPPCVPKNSKVYERSEHPFAVQVRLELRASSGGQANAQGQSLDTNKVTYFVNPEFKPPLQKQVKAAVKVAKRSGNAAVAGAKESIEEEADDAAVADTWVWGTPGWETMHPFWAVRRMTQKQLAREAIVDTAGQVPPRLPPRFNCKLQMEVMTMVIVGVVKDRSLGTTRLCEVPFLTNTLELEEGEELFLEVHDKAVKKEPPKRTWKHAFKELETQEKKKAVAKQMKSEG
jgi:hypothetical protein